jgi:uncharacterized SAM-binding protein YcdF (DUF218 family)
MFAFKKLVGALLFPNTILLALLGVGVLLLWIGSRRRHARVIITIAAAGFFLMSYTSIWSFLVRNLEYRYPVLDTARNDLAEMKWVVVLGGGGTENDSLPAASQLNPQSVARVVEGIRILKSSPQAKLLLSGDSSAVNMQGVAQMLGIEPDRTVIEKIARDTEQEAIEVQRIVGNDRFVLVTSAIHLPRSMALFMKRGMTPVPAPADFLVRPSPEEPSSPSSFWGFGGIFPASAGATRADAMIHEYLGLLWGKLSGRI